MKRILSVLLILLFVGISSAQGAGIKKFPGENATVSWTFATTDESKITGFRIKASATSAGPYTFTGTTALPAARQVVFPVSFSTNSVLVFYQVVAYYTAGTTTVESDPVPVGGVEVDLNVPMPAGVQVK
jgi:hypothetical protein